VTSQREAGTIRFQPGATVTVAPLGVGMIDLNNLIASGSGWVLTSAEAINDKGQIVGWGTLNGTSRAFLLDPSK
jgi:probable HAF family extracellular repeat protein